jgi:hypothetical protein
VIHLAIVKRITISNINTNETSQQQQHHVYGSEDLPKPNTQQSKPHRYNKCNRQLTTAAAFHFMMQIMHNNVAMKYY